MLPIPTKKALKKLGGDLKRARLRRRIPMKLMAERAFISRTTLTKIENGDPSVSIGSWGSIIFALGLTSHLANLLDPALDLVGNALEEEILPRRIRLPRRDKHGE